ncbi:MAG: cytochrome c3 family protein [bacterium]
MKRLLALTGTAALLCLSVLSCRIFYDMQAHPRIPFPLIKGAKRSGNAACAGCHKEPQIKTVFHSAHRGIMEQSGLGCEACHGRGSLHVKSQEDKANILNPIHLPDNKSIRICDECHHLVGWAESVHAQNYLTCLSCHRIHGEARKFLLKTEEKKLCTGCHYLKKISREMPAHEKLLQNNSHDCTSCHRNVHRIKALFLKKFHHEADCINCHRN